MSIYSSIYQKYLNNLKSKEVQNSIGMLIDKGFKFLNSVTFLICSKYISINLFAELSYALTIVFFLSIYFESGIKEIFILEYHKNPENKKLIINNSFVLLLILEIIFYILLFSYSIFESNTTVNSIILLLSISYILKPLIVVKFEIEANLNLLKYYAKLFPILLLGFIIKLSLIYFFNTEPLLLISMICLIISFENIIESIILFFYFEGFPFSLTGVSINLIKKISIEVLPLFTSSIMIALYVRLDQILMRFLTTEKELGLYAIAVRFIEISYTISGAYLASQFSGFIQSNTAQIDLESHTLAFFIKNIKFNLFITILVLFFCISICFVLYEKEVRISVINLTTSLAVANFFVILGTTSSFYQTVKKMKKIRVLSTLLGLLTNLISVIIFVPFLGAWGAVVASFLSYGVAGFGYMFFFKEMDSLRRKFIDFIKCK